MPDLFSALDGPPKKPKKKAPSSGSVTPEDRSKAAFSFIDLFAGIGGLRLGLDAVGGKCVFSCEIDKFAQKTYGAWFGETPHSDVTQFSSGEGIPEHDLLAAGFPCQPFSIAGVSKKNSLGRAHGFNDKAQGTLFFHLASIIEAKQPGVLLLENVKNLRSHNKGDTWRTISERLDELGYRVFDRTIDAAAYVPQHRERIFIVGFRRDLFGDNPPFCFPERPTGPTPKLEDILEAESSVPEKYVLTAHLWNYLQAYAIRHQQKGNGFGCSVADRKGITRTLSARYYKDGSEILIPRGEDKIPRRLMPLEAGRLMGFPEHLVRIQVVSDTQAYRQFGNAVVPKVSTAIAEQISKVLQWHHQQTHETS
jgi:DNA (cytosine-5)-methyltransferase 1